MKDPSLEDPRYVSAYSVYKGLANLKSYEDHTPTGGGLTKSQLKRRSKKRMSANVAQNGESEVKVVPSACSSKPEQSKVQPNGTPKLNSSVSSKKGKKEGQKNETPSKSKLQEKNNTVSIQSPVNGSSESESVAAKKKRKKKKKKSNGNTSISNATLDLPSDDDEEPPAKTSRKSTGNLVPNPVANLRTNPCHVTPSTKGKGPVPNESEKKRKKASAAIDESVATSKQSTPARPGPTSAKKQAINGSAKSASQPATPATSGKQTVQVVKPKTPQQQQQKVNKNLNITRTLATVKPSKSRDKSAMPHTVTSKESPIDIKTLFNTKRTEDSIDHAKEVLQWLINPVTSDQFMNEFWEKKPLLIKRKHSDAADYYKWILTSQLFDDVLRRNPIKYGINLDITSYVDGKRETLSETMQGRVRPAVVWDYYNNGCSVRMLNPQTYVQPLWRLNASLQEWFGSFVGANMYLTPPDSQGFAPHYDDIDAFILQVEGKKRWKLYGARKEEEKLPRFSSPNFSEETDNLGEPILDVVLEEGDLLYFPRGVIHQAQTVDGEHSLHITLSCNQLNTYGDMLKHHLNHALDKLIAKDISFRKGLPTDYLSFMGIAHENSTNKDIKKKREAFTKTVSGLVTKLTEEPADFACDTMGKKFIWDSLPPYLNAKERKTTVFEDGEFMVKGKVLNRVEFGPETEVKFIRKNCVRLVVEDELIKLYFSSENPMVYHEDDEPQYLEISLELAPAINHLISQYPEYTKIEDLPISSEDIGQTIQVVSDLWERGLLFTKESLEPCDYDDFESDDEEDDSFGEGGNQDTSGVSKDGDDEDDDAESINLSDLPEEGDDSDDDEDEDDSDDFYDSTLALDSDDSDDDDEDFDGDEELFVNDDDEEGDDSDAGSGFEYGEGVDGDPEFVEVDDDDDDDDDDEDGEEQDDEEEIDFDELDRMEDSDDNDN